MNPDSPLPKQDIQELAESIPIDDDSMFLTERQAVVLLCRERGMDQGTIADYFSCSRANVSNIERSARRNIEKAHETVAFESIISSPVHVRLSEGLALHDVPERIFSVSDEAGVKVDYGASELIRKITGTFPDSHCDGVLTGDLVVAVPFDGSVKIKADE